MTLAARPWLPDSALLGERTLSLAQTALAQWSATWLAAGQVLVPAGGWQLQLGPVGGDDRQFPGGLAIACREEERLHLAALLLGTPVTARSLRTEPDHAVIGDLVADAIEALGMALVAAFGPRTTGASAFARLLEEDSPPAAARRFTLACTAQGEAAPVAAISLPDDVLVASVLQAAPKARIAPGARPLPEAWSAQPVSLGAILGSCQLPLAEIERLRQGDVIVLDQALGAPLDLTIDHRPVASAAACVLPAGQTQTLVIERPADQW